MLSMFHEILLDHFQNPRNVGELAPPALQVEVSNPACGDILRLSVRLESGVVLEARYKSRGCTASVAAGSALTEWLIGKDLARLRLLTAETVAGELGGLPPESRHAAVLAADSVREILRVVTAGGAGG